MNFTLPVLFTSQSALVTYHLWCLTSLLPLVHRVRLTSVSALSPTSDIGPVLCLNYLNHSHVRLTSGFRPCQLHLSPCVCAWLHFLLTCVWPRIPCYQIRLTIGLCCLLTWLHSRSPLSRASDPGFPPLSSLFHLWPDLSLVLEPDSTTSSAPSRASDPGYRPVTSVWHLTTACALSPVLFHHRHVRLTSARVPPLSTVWP